MEIIRQEPWVSDYVPLSTHQSQTPVSFYLGPPVLYHRCPSSVIRISQHDLELAPAFAPLVAGGIKVNAGGANGHGGPVEGDGNVETEEAEAEDQGEEIEMSGVDVWITSERLILYSSALTTGLSLPYPSISLHAIQRPSSIYLQVLPSLSSENTFDDHDPDASISLTITPPTSQPTVEPAPNGNNGSQGSGDAAHLGPQPAPNEQESDEEPKEDALTLIYNALSDCANLHPDPPLSDEGDYADELNDRPREEDGPMQLRSESGADGLPPPFPGSGGWITAQNADRFFDEEGNWRENGESRDLGEGAGRVRRRDEETHDEAETGEGEGTNGVEHGGESAETKWRRTG